MGYRELAVDVRSLHGIDCWDVGDVMANLTGAKVLAIKSLGEKLKLLTVEMGGKTGDIKAWNNDAEGIEPGHVFQSGETEKKPPYNRPDAPPNEHETWIKSPPKSGGGRGGGPAKSDPVKNEIIQKANKNNNDTIAYASNLKAAVSCMEMAVTTLGPGLDVNEYRNRGLDIFQAVKEIAHIGGKA